MANTFLNHTASGVGTSGTTVYTVPASTTAVVIGLNAANVETSQIAVDAELASTFLVKGAPIPANSALSLLDLLDSKIILEAGDTVVVTSDTAASADVILSVLEQT
jgi:hypothetical protein